ncbi:hypothetical protein HGB47_10850 [Leptospira yasudae]|uniref:hypothetical protein n=1 Tax=Leptospira yasudae TaxID=2202201 RepID=UPI001C4E3011|nr:hypothetical protein [Leptospira yasudae]MBW0434114.1 hypothetical protein [Leptospira yasudae]
MKKNVVIHIDTLRREYSSAWLLAKRFERLGFTVYLTSRTSTNLFLKFMTPDILILSHSFTFPQDRFRKLKEKGTKIYVAEVEGIYQVENAIASSYPEYVDFDNFEKVFVWNEWSKKWLEKNRNLEPSKVVASGCSRNDLVKHITVNDSKRRVGIIGRFEMVNPFDDRHPFANLRYLSAEAMERWHVDLDAFIVTRDLIKHLLSQGYKVSLRPHPNEKISSYSILEDFFGNGFEVDTNFDYYNWLESIDKVVGTVSTAFLEPYLVGIPIVCIDKLFNYKGPDNLKEWRKYTRQAAYIPESMEDLKKIFLNNSLTPKKSKALDDYTFKFYNIKSAFDSRSMEMIVDSIVKKNNHHKKGGALEFLYIPFLRYLVDAAACLRAILQRRGAWTLQNLRQYDYNIFLHKPSAFMVKVNDEAHI